MLRKFLWIQQDSVRATVAHSSISNMLDYSHGEAMVPAETYSTEGAAAKLGVSKSTILRWLRQGRIDEVRRDRNGWRVFTSADLKAIRKRMGL